LPAFFFRLSSGKEPVREWLLSDVLSDEDRRRIGESVRVVERGWPVGMPTCRAMGAGLWEIRTRLHERTARIIFSVHEGHMVLLHAFIKKSQAAPAADLRLASKRKRELERER
jgi:phage-related protein